MELNFWSSRVDSSGIGEWGHRLLVNGTYPVFPWLAFSTLGAIIAEFENDFEQKEHNGNWWNYIFD